MNSNDQLESLLLQRAMPKSANRATILLALKKMNAQPCQTVAFIYLELRNLSYRPLLGLKDVRHIFTPVIMAENMPIIITGITWTA